MGGGCKPGTPKITGGPIARGHALPDETPEDVLSLAAAFPGTRLLVVIGEDHGAWPAILDTNAPGTECFAPVDLGQPAQGISPDPLEGVHVYVIGCP